METETRGRRWRTLEEVARELQVSPEAVERLVAAGELASIRVDGALRFHPSVVKRCGRRAERQATLRRWRRRALAGAGVAAAALACVVTLAVSPPLAGEKVPRQLPYRGSLDLNGAPVTDPQTTMRFELFTAESGGAAAWSEEQSGISVLDGQFSAALGDVVPIPPALFAQPSLYLAITVNGQSLQGRQRLLTVPYAHYSAGSNAVPAGTVVAFTGSNAPPGWLSCDGSAVSRAAYPALFALIGTTYGAGDGSTTFNLPDGRGRAHIGAGRGPGLTERVLGATGGAETHTLTVDELPPHDHAGSSTDSRGSHQHEVPVGETFPFNGSGVWRNNVGWDSGYGTLQTPLTSSSGDHAHGVTVQSQGGGGAHASMPPFLAVNWIIKAVD